MQLEQCHVGLCALRPLVQCVRCQPSGLLYLPYSATQQTTPPHHAKEHNIVNITHPHTPAMVTHAHTHTPAAATGPFCLPWRPAAPGPFEAATPGHAHHHLGCANACSGTTSSKASWRARLTQPCIPALVCVHGSHAPDVGSSVDASRPPPTLEVWRGGEGATRPPATVAAELVDERKSL